MKRYLLYNQDDDYIGSIWAESTRREKGCTHFFFCHRLAASIWDNSGLRIEEEKEPEEVEQNA